MSDHRSGVEAGHFRLDSTFVQLLDGPDARQVPVDPAFWERLGERTALHAGRLMMVSHQTERWRHWEMHPEGEEILYLMSGAMTVLLDRAEGETAIALGPGDACIVPRGVWHTATVDAPSDLLSITRGRGTRHRPRSDDDL